MMIPEETSKCVRWVYSKQERFVFPRNLAAYLAWKFKDLYVPSPSSHPVYSRWLRSAVGCSCGDFLRLESTRPRRCSYFWALLYNLICFSYLRLTESFRNRWLSTEAHLEIHKSRTKDPKILLIFSDQALSNTSLPYGSTSSCRNILNEIIVSFGC